MAVVEGASEVVRAGDNLSDVLMRPLNFHDGEVVKLILDRRGPTLTVDVLLTNLSPRSYEKLPPGNEIPHLVTIRFDEVEDLQLDDFNHQNVIQDLVLTPDDARLKVQVPSLFGADFSLTCSGAVIVGIRPTTMRPGHPLEDRNEPDSGNS